MTRDVQLPDRSSSDLNDKARLVAEVFEGRIVGAGEDQTEEDLKSDHWGRMDTQRIRSILKAIWVRGARPPVEAVESDPDRAHQRRLRGEHTVAVGPFVRMNRINQLLVSRNDRQGWMRDEILDDIEQNAPTDMEDIHISLNQFRKRDLATKYDLKVINALVLELDYELAETPPTQDSINEVCESMEIPKPSIIIESGGGFHLVWLIARIRLGFRNGSYGKPSQRKIRWYHDVAKRLHHVFKDLGSDPRQPLQPTQLIRLPGSWNPNYRKPVELHHVDLKAITQLEDFRPLKEKIHKHSSEDAQRSSIRTSNSVLSSPGFKHAKTVTQALPPPLQDHIAIRKAMSPLNSPYRFYGASTLIMALNQGPAAMDAEAIHQLMEPVVAQYIDSTGGIWGIDGDDAGKLNEIINGILQKDYTWVESLACAVLDVENPKTVGRYRRGRGKKKAPDDHTPGPEPTRPDPAMIARQCQVQVELAAIMSHTITYRDFAKWTGINAKKFSKNIRTANGERRPLGEHVINHLNERTACTLQRASRGFKVTLDSGDKPRY